LEKKSKTTDWWKQCHNRHPLDQLFVELNLIVLRNMRPYRVA